MKIKIPEFDNYYISSQLTVHMLSGEIITPYNHSHGYKSYSLKRNDKWVKVYAHRIIACCFIPNQRGRVS